MRGALALARALDPLSAPPTASDDYVSAVDTATGGDWGMFLNGPGGSLVPDGCGDCVIADSAHQVMLHTANAGTIVIPTDQDVLGMYEAVGGYVLGDAGTDQGCDETAACQYLQATGLSGQKSAGSGMVDPTNFDHIRWSVQLFGACRLGIVVTQAMMDDFDAGRPWTAITGDVLGGHDVPVVRFDVDGVDVVTWAKLQRVTWSLMANASFLQEAHAEVWPDFVRANGTAPNNFSLSALLAELQALQEAA
jgi:hypothetical protein